MSLCHAPKEKGAFWKRRLFSTLFGVALALFPGFSRAQCSLSDEAKKTGQTIASDFKAHYSLKTLGKTAIGLGLSGLIAHTDADHDIEDWVQDSVRDTDTDHVSKAVKDLGSWQRVTPFYLTLAASGAFFKEYRFLRETGSFGAKTLRAFLVGMPSVLFWQFSLGASRPSDDKDSKWHPTEDNNSVSGHAFTGAVPFLTAATMTDSPCLKSILYLGSTATAFSRINDHQHYLSQTLLGWWFAFLAVESVGTVSQSPLRVTPLAMDDGFGIMITWHF